MINRASNTSNSSKVAPSLSYWRCDNYPYYIPSIHGIKRVFAPIMEDDKVPVIRDELHCILKGSATYELIHAKTGESTFIKVEKNDIMFLSSGMQYYIIRETSADFECLKISFYLYTCNNVFTSDAALNFSEALDTPITHRRMTLYLPRLSHFNYGDQIHNHISNIMEYRHMKKNGYIIQIQSNLLQLIFCILSEAKEKHNNILKNANLIGITSKYSPFAVMPKGCKLSVSDVVIYDSNPHSNSSKSTVLSVFCAHKNYKLTPDDDSLITEDIYDQNTNKKYIELSATNNSLYHIWIYPKKDCFTPDLREYSENSYLRFYAKSNTEMRFGIVVYNHDIHQFISHTFFITPSKTYTEYCVPLLGGEEQNIQSPHIHRIIDYITQNYDRKIKVEDIAKSIHLNSSYISTKFKEEMGISISDYILDYRLSIAKKLLISSPESPISEIALASGFYDTAHFSKSFKKVFLITAKEYRNRNSHINASRRVEQNKKSKPLVN